MTDNNDAKFTDLFRPSAPRSPRALRKERLDICKECDHYSKITTQCGVCGCIMQLKTTLADAVCPIGKW